MNFYFVIANVRNLNVRKNIVESNTFCNVFYGQFHKETFYTTRLKNNDLTIITIIFLE